MLQVSTLVPFFPGILAKIKGFLKYFLDKNSQIEAIVLYNTTNGTKGRGCARLNAG